MKYKLFYFFLNNVKRKTDFKSLLVLRTSTNLQINIPKFNPRQNIYLFFTKKRMYFDFYPREMMHVSVSSVLEVLIAEVKKVFNENTCYLIFV